MLCLARIFQRFELRLDAERHTGPLDLRSSECESCPGFRSATGGRGAVARLHC